MNLEVTIDRSSGFCFGVVYAIDMVEAILEEQGYLYCLGDIVHNDEEVERFAVQVGNDTDGSRRSRYQEMACIISPECQLSESATRVLDHIFGKVVRKTL